MAFGVITDLFWLIYKSGWYQMVFCHAKFMNMICILTREAANSYEQAKQRAPAA